MGLRLGILVVSMAANVALAVLIFRRDSPPPPPSVGSDSPALQSPPARLAARSSKKDSAVPDAPTPLPLPGVAAFDWSQLESQDYKEYIARLRAFGVPDHVLRDIIIADVNKLYRPRLAALRPPTPIRTNFWEQSYGPGANRQPREQREQLRALQKEQLDLIKDLLGKDVYQRKAAESGYPDSLEQSFGSMTAEQRDKVSEIQERYQRMTSAIYEDNDHHVDDDTRKELRAVRARLREELATVLTPEQVEHHELRSSDTASNMRYELRSFEPNEEEFRAIFKYKQAKEELDALRDHDPSGRLSPDAAKARSQKQKELEDALAQSLSPERSKEFKLSENYEYRNLFEAGVDKESIFKLADMKQDVEATARTLRQDKAISEEQRTAALAAVRAETEKSLTELLGDRRARGYLGNSGYWLRNIAPKP